MQAHTETYKGCNIVISENGQLSINDKMIECSFDNAEQNWSSRYLPYSQYSSLLELARATIANTAEFGIRPQ